MEIGSVNVANTFNNSQKLILLTYVAIFAMTSRVLLSSILSKRHKDKVGVIFAASTGHLKYGLSMMTPVKLSLKWTLIVSISLAISVAQKRELFIRCFQILSDCSVSMQYKVKLVHSMIIPILYDVLSESESLKSEFFDETVVKAIQSELFSTCVSPALNESQITSPTLSQNLSQTESLIPDVSLTYCLLRHQQ
jgi:hypothetical protein